MGTETKKKAINLLYVFLRSIYGLSKPGNPILGKLVKKYDYVNPLTIKPIKRNMISSTPRIKRLQNK